MAEYRLDLMTDGSARIARSEHFTAKDTSAACVKADAILRRIITNPATQYGDLYTRDPGGGGSAEYVDTISLETTS